MKILERLGLTLFIHMDYFYDVLMNFLKHQSFSGMKFQWKNRNLSGFIKKIS